MMWDSTRRLGWTSEGSRFYLDDIARFWLTRFDLRNSTRPGVTTGRGGISWAPPIFRSRNMRTYYAGVLP